MKITLKDNNLQILRIKNGLSCFGLSKLAGLSKLSVERIEQKLVNPRPQTAKKICQALQVDFDEIFKIID